MISLSSPPEAKYIPPFDHRTQFTHAGERNREISVCGAGRQAQLRNAVLLGQERARGALTTGMSTRPGQGPRRRSSLGGQC